MILVHSRLFQAIEIGIQVGKLAKSDLAWSNFVQMTVSVRIQGRRVEGTLFIPKHQR